MNQTTNQTNTPITEKLKQIIANKLDVDVSADELDENVSLYEDGIGLDSIAIVEFITLIEKEFSITIEDEELNTELFKSLNTVADFVQKKLKN